jgi:hypothetical protein
MTDNDNDNDYDVKSGCESTGFRFSSSTNASLILTVRVLGMNAS